MDLINRIASRTLTIDDEKAIVHILGEYGPHYVRILKENPKDQKEYDWFMAVHVELGRRLGVAAPQQAVSPQITEVIQVTNEDLIKKGTSEPDIFFRLRHYFATELFQRGLVRKEDLESYSNMLFNRAQYGVRYPQKQEEYLIHIEKLITASH